MTQVPTDPITKVFSAEFGAPTYSANGVEMSLQIGKLSEAMAKAQAEIKNPGFDSTNPQFKSGYVSLAAITAEVRRAFSMHGLAVMQPAISGHDEAGMLYGCETIISHESGEWIRSTLLLPVIEEGRQSLVHTIGAILTYAKKYSLISICLICGDEDQDGNDAGGTRDKDKKAPIRKPAPEAQPEGSGTRAVPDNRAGFGEVGDTSVLKEPARTEFEKNDPNPVIATIRHSPTEPLPDDGSDASRDDDDGPKDLARVEVMLRVKEWTKCQNEDLGRCITIIGSKLNLRKRNGQYGDASYKKITKYAVMAMSDGVPWDALDPVKD